MSVGEILDQPTIDIEAVGTFDEGLAVDLIQRAVEHHLGESSGDRWLWFLSHPALLSEPRLMERVLARLLDANPSLLPELGHLREPPQLVNFLADKYRYPEAVLTVAKRLYLDCGAATAEFEGFLEQHANNEWMLKSLVHLSASHEDKEQALSRVLTGHSDLYNYYIEVRRSLQRQARAATETDAERIQELFETRDPAVLRGLATNPHASEVLLEKLTQIKGIKGSREIRQRARDALRSRLKIQNG